jgi:hypothetical protein
MGYRSNAVLEPALATRLTADLCRPGFNLDEARLTPLAPIGGIRRASGAVCQAVRFL